MKATVKTVMVGSSSPPNKGSGINAYVNQLVHGFIAAGHKIIYVAPQNDRSLPELDIPFLHLVVGQEEAPLQAGREILGYLAEQKVDLIINNDNPYLQAVAPMVNTVFVSVGHMSQTSVAKLACFNDRWVDYVIAISADMQSTFVNKFRLDTAKVPIVYNGVNDPFNNSLPPYTPKKKLKLVYAGGNGANKGAQLLMSAVKDRRWDPKKVELHWFGYMDSQFKQQLEAVGGITVYGRVPRPEFIEALKSADGFLLLSYAEGCPMAMLEAMSYGIVPVASNGIGAMQRLIIHGQEGYICRLDDWSNDFYAILDKLIGNHELIDLMRHAAYARFRSDFLSTNTVDKIIALSDVPTVDRSSKPEAIQLLRWHRPTLPGTNKAPILDRICIKAGVLRMSDKVQQRDLTSS